MLDIFSQIRQNICVQAKPKTFDRKIFLTRSKLKKANKNEINIDYLDKFFISNGYELVYPEKISLKQLIILFNEASHIACISGTLSHNILFANPNKHFIIIERSAINNSYQVGINLIMNIKPVLIDCFELPLIAPATGELFLYSSTPYLKNFTRKMSYSNDCFPQTTKDLKSELKLFVSRYKQIYGRTIGINIYNADQMPAIAEAYSSAEKRYQRWLKDGHALFLYDWFSLRFIAKAIFRILKNIKTYLTSSKKHTCNSASSK